MLIFKYFFWLALCLIYVTATARINIFCVGYFVACFYFMHFGQSLHLKPLRDILRPWDYVIAYTTLVITVKNLLAVCNGLMFVISWVRLGKSIYCKLPQKKSYSTFISNGSLIGWKICLFVLKWSFKIKISAVNFSCFCSF